MNHLQDLSAGHIRKVKLNVILRFCPQGISSRTVCRAYPQSRSLSYPQGCPQGISVGSVRSVVCKAYPQDLSARHILKICPQGISARCVRRAYLQGHLQGISAGSVRIVILNVILRVCPQGISSRSVRRAYKQDLP